MTPIEDARTTSSGVELHLLVHVGVVSLALGEEELGGSPTEQLARLAHRAQRHRRGAGELDVVVADDRQLARHVDPDRRHLLQQSQREEVVGTERRGRASSVGSPARRSPARRPSATLSAAVSNTSSASAGRPFAAMARREPSSRSVTWTVDIGPPTKAMRSVVLFAEVGHGERAALDVIDADAAEAGPAVAVDEHDGDAPAGEPVERCGVLVDGRDEHAANPLLQQQFEVVALHVPRRCRCCR